MNDTRKKIIDLLDKSGYELLTDAKDFIYVGLSSTNWITINLPYHEKDTYYVFTASETEIHGIKVIAESVCPKYILWKIDRYANKLVK